MNKHLLCGLLAVLPGLTLAQPRAKAKPAPKHQAEISGPYFQQEVKYLLDVRLDDQHHVLRGHEELTYQNNSPQTLSFIWFHLWPNAYRDNNTAFGREQQRQGHRNFLFAPTSQRGRIDSLSFVVNGQAAKLEFDPENPDIAKLMLPQPLAPGAAATIATPFRVKLPGSFSRLGHVGQSYQISQWFPKPAVLDRRGWHPIPYLTQGEFFSEFGSFDVSITLPSNYTVGATGELQNPDERARLAELAAATATKKTDKDFGTPGTIKGANKDMTKVENALAAAFPTSATTTKTLRYRQDRVHDFAWFADKRFNVLQDTVHLPSGRVVETMVLFTNHKPVRWIQGLEEVNSAVRNYSRWVGEYPYTAATAVDGALTAGSGMEYPMVTVTEPDAIVHEVGHNWFYGILGSNERDFPWMDEGVNTYEQFRVSAPRPLPDARLLTETQLGCRIHQKTKNDRLTGRRLQPAALPGIGFSARTSTSRCKGPLRPITPTSTTASRCTIKTATLLKYLAGYLGQDKFDAAMHLYYTRWQFRHPYPEDMQAVFEESTGQKLGWFFGDMLTGTQPYDADLSAVAIFNDVVKVLVRTDSETPWAVPVSSLDAQTARCSKPSGRRPSATPTLLRTRKMPPASSTSDGPTWWRWWWMPATSRPELNRRNDRLTAGRPCPGPHRAAAPAPPG